MTEEQAKTKWCPHVRYKSSRGEGINRWQEGMDAQHNPEHSRCIGSACMAWRAVEFPDTMTRKPGEAPPPEADGWTKFSEGPGGAAYTRIRREGYCGLAGKP